MTVAVVVAGDGGLTTVGGVPMVALAVRALLDSDRVDRVTVLSERDGVAGACAGLPVTVRDAAAGRLAIRRELSRMRAHAGQRADRRSGDEPVLLLHDAARPLAPPALVTAVLEAAAAGHAAVVPVLPLADTVKLVDADGRVLATPDRAGLRIVQTPQAFRGEPADAVLAAGPLDPERAYATAGGRAHAVAGHPRAFAVRGAWDLRLAQLLVGRDGG